MLDPLSALVLIIGLGVGAEWISNRLGVPSIVLFLVAGILVGPATGVVNPDRLLGDALFPVVSLGVSIVLFEGGMRLRLSGLQSVRLPVLSLTTLGALVSWGGGAVLAWWILGFSPEVALLLGGILIVTGPTVVIPLLRDLEVEERLKTLTVWEGIVNDPLGAVLAVSVYQVAASGQAGTGLVDAAATLLWTIGSGAGVALLAAVFVVVTIGRGWVEPYMETPLTLGVVVGAFRLAEALSPEAGLIATTGMGVIMANQRRVDTEHILTFKENLGVLLVSFLFVLLAARIEWAAFQVISAESVVFTGLLLLVVRPLAVAVAGLPAGLKWREVVGLSVLAPRGIVAAAIGSLFAIKLAEAGYPEARKVDAEVFFVIASSVLLSGGIAGPVLRAVGVQEQTDP
ncbi:MAG: cation:proton antiporter [Salinibacter sp.]